MKKDIHIKNIKFHFFFKLIESPYLYLYIFIKSDFYNPIPSSHPNTRITHPNTPRLAHPQTHTDTHTSTGTRTHPHTRPPIYDRLIQPHTHTRTHHPNTQTLGHADTQTSKHPDTQQEEALSQTICFNVVNSKNSITKFLPRYKTSLIIKSKSNIKTYLK